MHKRLSHILLSMLLLQFVVCPCATAMENNGSDRPAMEHHHNMSQDMPCDDESSDGFCFSDTGSVSKQMQLDLAPPNQFRLQPAIPVTIVEGDRPPDRYSGGGRDSPVQRGDRLVE